MRVTQNMMTNNILRNLNRNLRSMEQLQYQMATGKKMRRPADDPANLVNALRNRSQRTEIEKYKTNVDDAITWLENTDDALGEINDIIHRVKEITVKGANDTYDGVDFKAMADEIRQLRDHFVQVANTKVGDKYIFGGTNTLEQPAVVDPVTGEVTWQGNNNSVSFEIGQGVTVPVNVTGDKTFYDGADVDIFKLLDNIATRLEDPNFNPDGNHDAVGDYLKDIDDYTNVLLTTRADTGARVNRLEHTDSWLTDLNLNLVALSSKMEDVDMAEAFTKFTSLENVYRASLSTGARIIQPSLVDFLR